MFLEVREGAGIGGKDEVPTFILELALQMQIIFKR